MKLPRSRAPLVLHTAALLVASSLLAACGSRPATASARRDHQQAPAPSTACYLADYPRPQGADPLRRHPAPSSSPTPWKCSRSTSSPNRPAKVAGIYVQDLDKTPGKPPRAWIDARSAFCGRLQKRGAMGPTIPSFGTRDGATKFAKANGGKVYPLPKSPPTWPASTAAPRTTSAWMPPHAHGQLLRPPRLRRRRRRSNSPPA